jgi:hypothetical protein
MNPENNQQSPNFNPVPPVPPYSAPPKENKNSSNEHHGVSLIFVIIPLFLFLGIAIGVAAGIIYVFKNNSQSKVVSPKVIPTMMEDQEIKTLPQEVDNNDVSDMLSRQTGGPTINPDAKQDLTSSSSADTTDNYVIKDTICYKILVPRGTDIGDENNCSLSYSGYINSSGKNILTGVSVWIDYHKYLSSKDMAQKWITKEKENKSTDTVISQETIKVGSYDGYKVIVKNSISSIETAHIFVYTLNAYKVNGYNTQSFEIMATFSDPDNIVLQKMEIARLLSSWVWK